LLQFPTVELTLDSTSGRNVVTLCQSYDRIWVFPLLPQSQRDEDP
jgi:hypothetical protein